MNDIDKAKFEGLRSSLITTLELLKELGVDVSKLENKVKELEMDVLKDISNLDTRLVKLERKIENMEGDGK